MTDIPSYQPKPFVFVLMPFAPEFDDIYRYGIKEACEKAGTYAERVDEQFYHERILDRIYNQIAKADIIIADMTGATRTCSTRRAMRMRWASRQFCLRRISMTSPSI